MEPLNHEADEPKATTRAMVVRITLLTSSYRTAL
jgi:hypothetical protein